jgi:hypothetical protein
MVTDKDTESFGRDGIAFLPGAFEQKWIELFRQGIEENISSPSERGRIWDRDAEGRSCFYDSQVWRDIGSYREFVLDSSCAEIAGRSNSSAAHISGLSGSGRRTLAPSPEMGAIRSCQPS